MSNLATLAPWLAGVDPTVAAAVLAAAVLLAALALALVLRARRRSRLGDAGNAEGGGPARDGAVLGAAPPVSTGSRSSRFRAGLARSRTALAGRIAAALGTGGAAAEEEIEQALVESDVGVRAARRLLDEIGRLPANRRNPSGVRDALKRNIEELVRGPGEPGALGGRPWVILVVGVNGVGKTTSIGKLAARHRAAGRSVLLVAGDTFRAAAADQLSVWAERTGAQIVRQAEGADPSAVAFDGLQAAVARGVDVVLVDTAGRLHTKVNLMEELRKVRRVIDRVVPGAPHEVFLVLDATTGQNALSQARTFAEAVAVTGVVLTKLDGTARGGVVVAIRQELGLPVRYVGLGESAEDLEPFDPGQFAAALVGDDADPS